MAKAGILIFALIAVAVMAQIGETRRVSDFGPKLVELSFLQKKLFRALKGWFGKGKDVVCALPSNDLIELCTNVFSDANVTIRSDEHKCETRIIDGFWSSWYYVRVSVYHCGTSSSFAISSVYDYFVSTDNTAGGVYLLRSLQSGADNPRPYKRIGDVM